MRERRRLAPAPGLLLKQASGPHGPPLYQLTVIPTADPGEDSCGEGEYLHICLIKSYADVQRQIINYPAYFPLFPALLHACSPWPQSLSSPFRLSQQNLASFSEGEGLGVGGGGVVRPHTNTYEVCIAPVRPA